MDNKSTLRLLNSFFYYRFAVLDYLCSHKKKQRQLFISQLDFSSNSHPFIKPAKSVPIPPSSLQDISSSQSFQDNDDEGEISASQLFRQSNFKGTESCQINNDTKGETRHTGWFQEYDWRGRGLHQTGERPAHA